MYFQATKDCVAKTLKRLEEKIHRRVSIFKNFVVFIYLFLWMHFKLFREKRKSGADIYSWLYYLVLWSLNFVEKLHEILILSMCRF